MKKQQNTGYCLQFSDLSSKYKIQQIHFKQSLHSSTTILTSLSFPNPCTRNHLLLILLSFLLNLEIYLQTYQ